MACIISYDAARDMVVFEHTGEDTGEEARYGSLKHRAERVTHALLIA